MESKQIGMLLYVEQQLFKKTVCQVLKCYYYVEKTFCRYPSPKIVANCLIRKEKAQKKKKIIFL